LEAGVGVGIVLDGLNHAKAQSQGRQMGGHSARYRSLYFLQSPVQSALEFHEEGCGRARESPGPIHRTQVQARGCRPGHCPDRKRSCGRSIATLPRQVLSLPPMEPQPPPTTVWSETSRSCSARLGNLGKRVSRGKKRPEGIRGNRRAPPYGAGQHGRRSNRAVCGTQSELRQRIGALQ
jgi:hypothetical protein